MKAITTLTFLPNSLSIVSGSRGGIVSLWNFKNSREEPRNLYHHDQEVSTIATAKADSTNGTFIIASGSRDTTVRVWEGSTDQEPKINIIKHKAHVSSVIFSPDNKRIASRSTDGRIIISNVGSDITTDKQISIKGEDQSEDTTILFSPDGKMLVSGSVDGQQSTVHVYSTEKGKWIWGKADGARSHIHYPSRLMLTPRTHLMFASSKYFNARSPYVILRGDNGESHAVRLVDHEFAALAQASIASELGPVFSTGPQPHRLTARRGPFSTKHTVFLSTAEDRPLWHTLATSGYYAAFGHEDGRITIINSEPFLKYAQFACPLRHITHGINADGAWIGKLNRIQRYLESPTTLIGAIERPGGKH
jgi:WD40 repeat protein